MLLISPLLAASALCGRWHKTLSSLLLRCRTPLSIGPPTSELCIWVPNHIMLRMAKAFCQLGPRKRPLDTAGLYQKQTVSLKMIQANKKNCKKFQKNLSYFYNEFQKVVKGSWFKGNDNGDVIWSSRSCDLALLDRFFLRMWELWSKKIDNWTNDEIFRVIIDIESQLCRDNFKNFNKRLNVLIPARQDYLKDVFFFEQKRHHWHLNYQWKDFENGWKLYVLFIKEKRIIWNIL